MSKIAMVAALEREVRPLVSQWRVAEKEHSGRRYRFFESSETVLVCGGIGPDAARRAAEAVIVLYSPSIVYSVGYAGALVPELKVGDVVYPGHVIDAKDGSSTAIAGGEAILISSVAVASQKQKATLRDAFQAQAVDMEAAAVARAAQARGVEFSVVKAISDEIDFEFPDTQSFIDSNGQFREASFSLYAAVRPRLWTRVMRLARNSSRATRALCGALQKILEKNLSLAESLPVDRR